MRSRRAAPAVLAALTVTIALTVPATAWSGPPSTGADRVPAVASPRPSVDIPWTQPSMPPTCSAAELAAGAVEGCLVNIAGRPESRGWPTAPFPVPDGAISPTWIDLAIGSSGSVVLSVQVALTSAGYATFADGQFGARTQTSVVAFQTASGLPPTGIVDYATASGLGVLAIGGTTFPPAGWRWLGWAYNGSTTLTAWESQFVRSSRSIGRIGVGQVRSFADAYPLFEGFLSEITARGYVVNDFGMYAFRCTSNSLKTCEGLTAAQLSNHAYGLAVDMNTTANPELTYYGVNGATACATPLRSDIPMWVVKVAERWGLYWGGYGWNGGCTSPSQPRSSVLRDTMHFEFRGTPALAKTIVARRASGATGPLVTPEFGAQSPIRLLDSRSGQPTGDGMFSGIGKVSAGSVTALAVAGRGFVPSDAAAVAINVTVTEPASAGFVTVYPCGNPVPGSSNVNFTSGVTVANLVVSKVGPGGTVCLYSSAAVHLVADVNASFPASAGVGAVTPARLLDTRPGGLTVDGAASGAGAVASGSITELQVAGRGGVTGTTAAVALNVTLTEPTSAGFVTVFPCDAPRPWASNVNVVAGQTVANLVIAKLGAGGTVCIFSSVTTHLVADVSATFAVAGAVAAMAPVRLLDTRPGQPTIDGTSSGSGAVAAGSVTELPVIARGGLAANEIAVALNVTITEPTSPGFVTVYPCGGSRPTASNLNFTAGATVANLVVAKVGVGGRVCLFSSAPAHLVADVNGTVGAVTTWSDLALGAAGARVVVLQQALTAAGHSTVADGQFGSRTRSAVIAVQTARGLTPTGVADRPTAATLGILTSGA
ncbi:MAG: peptidoglycan-binding protein [Ilumatobacteraceae bacterium]